jgi:hypothetical protein|tara:strand:+ start:2193 stop:2396 length:204 start_codon:yes stop_codon:yes gene_type:complete
MNNLIDKLILEFKKLKRVRGNLFENFITFCDSYMRGMKDDKYKEEKLTVLKYILQNRESILMKLSEN